MSTLEEEDSRDDLNAARQEAEARYEANRHSSDSSSTASEDDTNQERNARHQNRLKQWAESQDIWQIPPNMQGSLSAWQHFLQDYAKERQGQTNPGAFESENMAAWDDLSSIERERYETEAAHSRPRYIARAKEWQAQLPLSPSVKEEGSECDSEDDEEILEDEAYFNYKEYVQDWRRERMGVQRWVRYRRDYQPPSSSTTTAPQQRRF